MTFAEEIPSCDSDTPEQPDSLNHAVLSIQNNEKQGNNSCHVSEEDFHILESSNKNYERHPESHLTIKESVKLSTIRAMSICISTDPQVVLD